MKKAVKLIISVLSLLIIVGLFFSYRLTDLRPDGYTYPNDIEKAEHLLEAMGRAHQINKWNDLETYNVMLDDEFYGFLGKRSHSFEEQKIELSINYVPKTFNGQIKFLSGKEKDNIWGMQSWKTYKLDEKGNPIIAENKNMKFYIPTYQYFIEFPSRIQEATSIDYIGTKMIDGVEAEGIIASWNTVTPQKDLDQYIIWINSETKRIIQIDYTVRDKYRFVSGEATFQDYKDYSGIIIPSTIPIKSNLLKDGYLHKMSIKNFIPNKVSSKTLTPLN